MCGVFTRLFAERFKSLKVVPGYYLTSPEGASRGEHWWLVDSAGAIVDPTADQFPEREHGHYLPYDPRIHMVVKGKCLCCGVLLYSKEGSAPCSLGCDEELAAEFDCLLTGGPYEADMEFGCDLDLALKYGCTFSKEPTVARLIAESAATHSQAMMPQFN